MRLLVSFEFDDAFKHEVARDLIIFLEDLSKASVEIVRMYVGEKAEPAEVDAEHGNLAVSHLARRPQDRAVAAEDESEIGERQRREIPLLPQIDEQHLDLLLQKRQPALDLFRHARPFG